MQRLKCQRLRIFRCGDLFTREVNEILAGRGCPHCAHYKQWLNESLTTDEINKKLHQITPTVSLIERYVPPFMEGHGHQRRSFLFKCSVCEYKWHSEVDAMIEKPVCPNCMHNCTLDSRGKQCIISYLIKSKVPFVHPFIPISCRDKWPLHFDFKIGHYLIEFQGIQHFGPQRIGGRSMEEAKRVFKIQQKHDDIKKQWARENHYDLIEISKIRDIPKELRPVISQYALLDDKPFVNFDLNGHIKKYSLLEEDLIIFANHYQSTRNHVRFFLEDEQSTVSQFTNVIHDLVNDPFIVRYILSRFSEYASVLNRLKEILGDLVFIRIGNLRILHGFTLKGFLSYKDCLMFNQLYSRFCDVYHKLSSVDRIKFPPSIRYWLKKSRKPLLLLVTKSDFNVLMNLSDNYLFVFDKPLSIMKDNNCKTFLSKVVS